MPNALKATRSGFIVGHAFPAQGRTLKQAVHDGDTVAISPDSYLSTRLLGVDTPEVSFTLPGTAGFPSIGGAAWKSFLTDPLNGNLPPFNPALSPELAQHIRDHAGAGCATNHAAHAADAKSGLYDLVQADVTASGLPASQFHFFLAFARDVIDRYGRLLTFLHRDDPNNQPRPYNETLLVEGLAVPYFIWPNLNPFLRDATVPTPGEAIRGAHLDAARQAVRDARQQHKGIFSTSDPLELLPFELRYLARTTRGANPVRPGPDRWVIDLSNAAPQQLLHPQRYIEIANYEDRLFVNAEHVPLFVEGGWQRA